PDASHRPGSTRAAWDAGASLPAVPPSATAPLERPSSAVRTGRRRERIRAQHGALRDAAPLSGPPRHETVHQGNAGRPVRHGPASLTEILHALEWSKAVAVVVLAKVLHGKARLEEGRDDLGRGPVELVEGCGFWKPPHAVEPAGRYARRPGRRDVVTDTVYPS